MAPSLSDLIAQKAALERQIRDAQALVKSDAIAQVRKLMSEHGLSSADLLYTPKDKQGAKRGTKVQPKYRDPISGLTWSGRGLRPKWLSVALGEGKRLQDFAI